MNKKAFFRSLTAVAVVSVAVLFTACNKDKASQKVLNLTAINDSKSQVVNVKLKSNQKSMEFMEEKTFPINCRYMLSTTFNAQNKTFGYMDCNNAYRIMNIETGMEIRQIPLQESISMVVVDTIRNVLIGRYYIGGTGKYDGTDHVLTINLNDGSIISDNPFYVGGFWSSTYFFRDIENEYVLLKYPENVLVFINPSTGNVFRTLNLDTEIYNGVYDRQNNRLIGTTFTNGTDKFNGTVHIVTVDLNTGKTLSKVLAQGVHGFFGEEKDYDIETNSYILVSANNEVLFFDVATGQVNERYQLDFDVTSLKVWRSNK